MNDRDMLLILPDINRCGFSCTGSACAIRGVAMTAAPVAACVIRGVSVTAAHVSYCSVYHACTSDCVIYRVSGTASPVANRTGYHYCNSRVWIRHGC